MISIEPGAWMCKYTSKNGAFYKLKIDTNLKILNRHKLIDHKLNIIRNILYTKKQMKKSAYVIVAFLLLLADKYAKCDIDITIDVKVKCTNKLWKYEHLGYAYGNYDSFLYEPKKGYKCFKVTYGNTVIWKSVGNVRAERVVLSGRGSQRKMVEIDLDDDSVIYFFKPGRFSTWKRYISDNM